MEYFHYKLFAQEIIAGRSYIRRPLSSIKQFDQWTSSSPFHLDTETTSYHNHLLHNISSCYYCVHKAVTTSRPARAPFRSSVTTCCPCFPVKGEFGAGFHYIQLASSIRVSFWPWVTKTHAWKAVFQTEIGVVRFLAISDFRLPDIFRRRYHVESDILEADNINCLTEIRC